MDYILPCILLWSSFIFIVDVDTISGGGKKIEKTAIQWLSGYVCIEMTT